MICKICEEREGEKIEKSCRCVAPICLVCASKLLKCPWCRAPYPKEKVCVITASIDELEQRFIFQNLEDADIFLSAVPYGMDIEMETVIQRVDWEEEGCYIHAPEGDVSEVAICYLEDGEVWKRRERWFERVKKYWPRIRDDRRLRGLWE